MTSSVLLELSQSTNALTRQASALVKGARGRGNWMAHDGAVSGGGAEGAAVGGADAVASGERRTKAPQKDGAAGAVSSSEA